MNQFYERYNKFVHSQNGEDGVLEELIRRLNENPKHLWVCEFGAWDGIENSNTFYFVEKEPTACSAVYIEGCKEQFKEIVKLQERYPNIIAFNEYVIPGSDEFSPIPGKSTDPVKEASTLDSILQRTPIPIDFDILSIDIDSYDYQVWESLQLYKPKIVVIEIISSIQPDRLDYIYGKDPSFIGTSFMPMYLLGIKKGYKFVLHTGNMIFVREDLYDKLNLNPAEFRTVFQNFRRNWL